MYLSEEEVRSLLSMRQAIEQVERAFTDRTAGRAFDIPRQRARTPGGHLNLMQGASLELDLLGAKMYYVLPQGHTSLIHLIDRRTARLEAVMEAHWIGQMRTGAATAVAVRHLARTDASVVGMFGSGRQAVTQLQAVCEVRDIETVKVFSRDPGRLAKFCTSMSRQLERSVAPAESAEATVRDSDIIVTITRGGGPVFDGDWLEAGQMVAAAGVNGIDRRELDTRTVERADLIVVDSRETARRESGDLLSAHEAGLVYWENLVDLGEVVVGRHPGRAEAAQIILFESHGMALEDIYCASLILDSARALGVGSPFPPTAE